MTSSTPQLFRPVYSSWSTQLGRPFTSLEVYSDFWASSSSPLSAPASPAQTGVASRARRRLPASPPGRVGVLPNVTVPGEPAFVSHLVESGVSRLAGPLRDAVSEIDHTFMRIHELIRSHEASEAEVGDVHSHAEFCSSSRPHRSSELLPAHTGRGRNNNPEDLPRMGGQTALRKGYLGSEGVVPRGARGNSRATGNPPSRGRAEARFEALLC
jgi:hypothetical protein